LNAFPTWAFERYLRDVEGRGASVMSRK